MMAKKIASDKLKAGIGNGPTTTTVKTVSAVFGILG